MIDGVFTICSDCGGAVSVQKHLVNAHMSPDGGDLPVHLTWHHVKCAVVAEYAISVQDYKAALSLMKAEAGVGVTRIDSEGEESLKLFAVELGRVNTPADIGVWA